MLFSVSLPVSAPTQDSHALSRSLALPVSRGLKPYAISKVPPSSFLDSLVQDPRGPAPLLRIREENLDVSYADYSACTFISHLYKTMVIGSL